MRPHQSGNPDAAQYIRIFNGMDAWQLYYGDGYSGKFNYKFDEWQHIKINVDGLKAELYIDDTPVIKVKELLRPWQAGKIAVISGGAPLRITNVQYTIQEVTPPTRTPIPANGTGGLVTRWQVSNAVNGSLFEKQYQLTPAIKKKLTTTRQSEPSGTINLARFGR